MFHHWDCLDFAVAAASESKQEPSLKKRTRERRCKVQQLKKILVKVAVALIIITVMPQRSTQIRVSVILGFPTLWLNLLSTDARP